MYINWFSTTYTYHTKGEKQQMKMLSGYSCGLLFERGNHKQDQNESQHASPLQPYPYTLVVQ